MVGKAKELEKDTIILLRLPQAAQATILLHASGPMATKELVQDACDAFFKHTKDPRIAPDMVKQTLRGAAQSSSRAAAGEANLKTSLPCTRSGQASDWHIEHPCKVMLYILFPLFMCVHLGAPERIA